MSTKVARKPSPATDPDRRPLTGYFPTALADQIEQEARTHYLGKVSMALCKLAEEALAARRQREASDAA